MEYIFWVELGTSWHLNPSNLSLLVYSHCKKEIKKLNQMSQITSSPPRPFHEGLPVVLSPPNSIATLSAHSSPPHLSSFMWSNLQFVVSRYQYCFQRLNFNICKIVNSHHIPLILSIFGSCVTPITYLE